MIPGLVIDYITAKCTIGAPHEIVARTREGPLGIWYNVCTTDRVASILRKSARTSGTPLLGADPATLTSDPNWREVLSFPPDAAGRPYSLEITPSGTPGKWLVDEYAGLHGKLYTALNRAGSAAGSYVAGLPAPVTPPTTQTPSTRASEQRASPLWLWAALALAGLLATGGVVVLGGGFLLLRRRRG